MTTNRAFYFRISSVFLLNVIMLNAVAPFKCRLGPYTMNIILEFTKTESNILVIIFSVIIAWAENRKLSQGPLL
jgi:hypothetical protein